VPDDLVGGAHIAKIGAKETDLASGSAKFGFGIATAPVVTPYEQDTCAMPGKRGRARLSDPACSSRHNRCAGPDPKVHCASTN